MRAVPLHKPTGNIHGPSNQICACCGCADDDFFLLERVYESLKEQHDVFVHEQ